MPNDPQPRVPLWGYYDNSDTHLVEAEIDLASNSGISCFVFDWYYNNGVAFYETPIRDAFTKAKNRNRMKFMLMWANQSLPGWNFNYQEYDFKRMADDLIKDFIGRPNYWRIGGRPVFGIFLIKPMLDTLGAQAFKDVFSEMRRRVNAAGLGNILVMACEQHVPGLRALGFDGATSYQTMNGFGPGATDYAAAVARSIRFWELKAKDLDVPYFPDCSVGWDNSPRMQGRGSSLSYVTGRSPAQFEGLLRAAKRFTIQQKLDPPAIFISSWNEWTEDHYLLPDRDYGHSYLDVIRNEFRS
jgi:hypothetical protein